MKARRLWVRTAGVAGQRGIVATGHTTAADVLAMVGLPDDYELRPGMGQPKFASEERILERGHVADTIFASPHLNVD